MRRIRVFDRCISPWQWGLMATLVVGSRDGVHALEADRLLIYQWDRLALKPQMATSFTYTDNVFYGNNDGPFDPDPTRPGKTIPRRAQEDDLIAQFSPGFRLEYGRMALGTENALTLSYSHDEVLYLQHSDGNTRQDRLDFRARYQRGRWKLEGTDQVYFLSSYLSGGQTVGAVIVDRLQWNDDYRLSYDWTEKTDLYGRVRHFSYDFSGDLPGLLDQETFDGTLGSNFRFSEKIFLFGEATVGHTAVAGNTGGVSSKLPGRFSYGGFLGVRGEFTPKLEGNLRLGFEQSEFENGGPSSSSPALDVGLTYLAAPKTTLRLNLLRRTGVSFQVVEQSYVSQSVDFSVIQGLGRGDYWTLVFNSRADLGDYEGANFTTARFPKRSDLTLGAGLRLVYRPRRWLSSSLGYEFDKYDSDAVIEFLVPRPGGEPLRIRQPYLVDYINHRITLQISIGY